MNMPAVTGDVSWSIQGEKLHLIGKPSLCVGEISVRNLSAEKIRLKRIPLASSRMSGPSEISVSHLRVFGILPPGAAMQVPVQLPIPPQTPPGRYAAEAVIGGARKSVTIDVLESWDLAINPGEISLKLHPGERARRPVLLTNRGNMPYTLHRAAFAPLQDKDGTHRNIFLSLRHATAEPDYEAVLNDFVKRMQDTEVEPARIGILSDGRSLLPGETRDFEIEISLPEDLKRNRRYSGKATFENARLLLDIEVLGNSTPDNGENKKEKP